LKKKEVEDDTPNIKRFSPHLKSILLETHHDSISGRESVSGETVEGDSVF
jgi:hypothetical protein